MIQGDGAVIVQVGIRDMEAMQYDGNSLSHERSWGMLVVFLVRLLSSNRGELAKASAPFRIHCSPPM
jgi:hypothetical protein